MGDTQFPSQFREIMVRLQGEYLVQVGKHLPGFRRMRAEMEKSALSSGDLQGLYRLSHDFAGSGTTFGFPEISRTARELYLVIKGVLDDPAMGGDTGAAILGHMRAFEQALGDALGKSPREAAESLEVPEAPELPPVEETNDIYFMTDNKGDVAALAAQIRHFGYNVIAGAGPEAVHAALRAACPKAIIAFSNMSREDISLLQTVCGAAANRGVRAVPFIIISPRGDFETRLAAARLGAQGFFEGEADPLQLIDRIEQLSAKFAAPPRYNIMIVDDDKMLTEFYNHSLSRTGMAVTTLTNPKEVVAALDSKQIDLILIDFSMPGCNGQELAAVIRQHERYISLPIVFISSYEDLQKALVDTGLGIDDFLVKPFTPERLFSVVRSRARRAAELKSFMTRDSFTGLLNHAHFNEALAGALAHVRRGGKDTSYVMLDLDHFKSINDTYGHAAGDQVIKSISRMLQQHLRRSDIIGRCGGEEFGIVLPDCPLPKALSILEKIRLAFADTYFTFNGEKVRVTFSAGVVRVDPANDLDRIIKAADAALYTAKEQGRNRICTYED